MAGDTRLNRKDVLSSDHMILLAGETGAVNCCGASVKSGAVCGRPGNGGPLWLETADHGFL